MKRAFFASLSIFFAFDCVGALQPKGMSSDICLPWGSFFTQQKETMEFVYKRIDSSDSKEVTTADVMTIVFAFGCEELKYAVKEKMTEEMVKKLDSCPNVSAEAKEWLKITLTHGPQYSESSTSSAEDLQAMAAEELKYWGF